MTDSYYDLSPAQRDALADSPCSADSDDDWDDDMTSEFDDDDWDDDEDE